MAAFHGDPFMQQVVTDIIRHTEIEVALETGTYHGDSTLFMEELGLRVCTSEIREDNFSHAQKRFVEKDIQGFLSDGRAFLKKMMEPWFLPKNLFIFLDAHWQDDWPLKEELDILITNRGHKNFVVIVDDFDVPGTRMSGSAGGGGTPGDPQYGPRLKVDPTPCNLETFEKQLVQFEQVWFPAPSFDAEAPGFCIASDLDLTGVKGLRRHK